MELILGDGINNPNVYSWSINAPFTFKFPQIGNSKGETTVIMKYKQFSTMTNRSNQTNYQHGTHQNSRHGVINLFIQRSAATSFRPRSKKSPTFSKSPRILCNDIKDFGSFGQHSFSGKKRRPKPVTIINPITIRSSAFTIM